MSLFKRFFTLTSLFALLVFSFPVNVQAKSCDDGYDLVENDIFAACTPHGKDGWGSTVYTSIADIQNIELPLLATDNDSDSTVGLELNAMRVVGDRNLKTVLKEDYFTETGELPDGFDTKKNGKFFSGHRMGLYTVKSQDDNGDTLLTKYYFALDKGEEESVLYILQLDGVKDSDNFGMVKKEGKSIDIAAFTE